MMTVNPAVTVGTSFGLAASNASHTVSLNGVSTMSCRATDVAGNSDPDQTFVIRIDTETPVLSLPGAVIADATSPAGAIVTYLVEGLDSSGLVPAVACAPVSGSTFPIGTTTVNCTASDLAGNSTSGSFPVIVNGPSAQASNLIVFVENLNLPGGTSTSLTSTLQNAIDSFASGNTTSACNQLNAFITQVQALSGKKLTAAEASQLIAAANQIRTAQGCP